MPRIPHVFRRGAVYTWRRRVPVSSGVSAKSYYIQLSLKTRDPSTARRLSAILYAKSQEIFERMEELKLTNERAKAWLESIVKSELDNIQNRRAAEQDALGENAYEENRLDDELVAHACRLLSIFGDSATFDPARDQELAQANYTEDELKKGRFHLQVCKADYKSDGRYWKMSARAKRFFDAKYVSSLTYMQLRQLFFKGRSIAYSASLKQDEHRFEEAIANTVAYLEQENKERNSIFSNLEADADGKSDPSPQPEAPQAATVSQPVPVQESPAENTGYSTRIEDIAERFIERRKSEKDDNKALNQYRMIFRTFLEIVQVERITDLHQHHFSQYVDTLARLPTNYRKSAADRDLPLKEILVAAYDLPPEAKGLSVATVNRNLTFLGQLLQRARAEGHELDPKIDLTVFKQKRKVRAREERRAFTAEDVQALFRHPTWTGCQNKLRRRVPGPVKIQDGCFWAPLIAALSGCRREEVAGLKAHEVIEVDGIWCFDIKPNDNRNLKTASSKRRIPVHRQLIDLGFLEYVNRRKKRGVKADLFPDLKPKNQKAEKGETAAPSFGQKLGNHISRVIEDQIEDRTKKSFHSFRHYVIDVLNNGTTKSEHRDDLLGHESKSIGASRYGSGTSVQNLQMAVNVLPRIAALEPQCKNRTDVEQAPTLEM